MLDAKIWTERKTFSLLGSAKINRELLSCLHKLLEVISISKMPVTDQLTDFNTFKNTSKLNHCTCRKSWCIKTLVRTESYSSSSI